MGTSSSPTNRQTLGISAEENRVQRLCSQRIWSFFARKRGLNRKPRWPVHDDLVGRNFTATARNERRLTDITEHHTDECKLYLCAIRDVYSNRIERLLHRLADESLPNRLASLPRQALPPEAIRHQISRALTRGGGRQQVMR